MKEEVFTVETNVTQTPLFMPFIISPFLALYSAHVLKCHAPHKSASFLLEPGAHLEGPAHRPVARPHNELLEPRTVTVGVLRRVLPEKGPLPMLARHADVLDLRRAAAEGQRTPKLNRWVPGHWRGLKCDAG